ncbi:MAG TPA: hypothetical protein DCX17_03575 [Firmicutes bacterium]|nr:hypothetical protein [Bacillota bacterium]
MIYLLKDGQQTPMKQRSSLSPEKRSLIIGLIVYGIGIIVFFPFIFFNGWYYLLTGWLLGMAINLINFGLLMYQGHMLKQVADGTGNGGGLVPVMYFLRFALYIGGLVLVGVLHNSGLDYFNIFTTFGAYLVISAVIFFSGMYYKKSADPKK